MKKEIDDKTSDLFLCASCGGIEVSEILFILNSRDHSMVSLTIDNVTNKIIYAEPPSVWERLCDIIAASPDNRNVSPTLCSLDDHSFVNRDEKTAGGQYSNRNKQKPSRKHR